MGFPKCLPITMFLISMLFAAASAADQCSSANDCIKLQISCTSGKLLKCIKALCVCISVHV
ncbi:unnamed protein product [Acanthoscelides obtectus]|uniref:Uncharacterized protein n=1 Tax=Acanthoscelides obtectus TaxID=200917 RepID=A0A9P0LSR5_ACAOB|nr:unnamed protein product [Acanthoscelides obtectus]CAK1626544.1 hypothetical protein AOBTE_LOCUS3915 [Acanthoscelides obtectus]